METDSPPESPGGTEPCQLFYLSPLRPMLNLQATKLQDNIFVLSHHIGSDLFLEPWKTSRTIYKERVGMFGKWAGTGGRDEVLLLL